MEALSDVLAATPISRFCIHCGNQIADFIESPFCCLGCETVFQLLNDRGLSYYYQLKKRGSAVRKSSPAPSSDEKYEYLDDEEFINLYSWSPTNQLNEKVMEFYLEGVHCVACVWLTEKISNFLPGVDQVRLNLGSSLATVKINKEGSFGAVAREFVKMGYRPHPVKREDGGTSLLQNKENRLLLIQIAVAGACAGNIMLLAISLYAGAVGELATWFRWISAALFLPVFIFSGSSFYKSAWSSIKMRRASIDVPVVFGIVTGSVVSFIHLIYGSDQIYFDSISALIFLLLCTRYILKKTQQTALGTSHLLHFLTPSSVRRWNTKKHRFEEVKIDQVKSGEILEVLAGSCIPADGVVVKGASTVTNALLTGESKPVPVLLESEVYAGTQNLSAAIEIRISRSGSATRLGQILKSMEESLQSKAAILTFTDRVSQIFVLFVVFLSALVFILELTKNWQEGLERALAIALVTCPCAFALGTPLTLSLTVGRLAKRGILIKGAEIIEKLSKVKSIFLDKTGTLTDGDLKVLKWQSKESSEDRTVTFASVMALESKSNHLIAKALVHYISTLIKHEAVLKVEDYKETIGRGISGRIAGKLIEVSRAKDSNRGTELAVYKDGALVASIFLGDRVREDSSRSIDQFRTLNLRPWLLSGDTLSAVYQVADQVGIPRFSCIAEVSPEQKKEVIESYTDSLMVGDGANDAIALAAADVGVAIHKGVEMSLRASDVYLSSPGVGSIYQMIIIARETMKVIKRNFIFSIIYNIIAGVAAICGLISPLFAAVLMPFSALSVFLSSISGTARMKAAFSELDGVKRG